MKIAASVLALLSATVAANAADLVVEAVPEVYAPTYDFTGVFELGASWAYTQNESDPFEGSAPGAHVSGAVSGGSDGFIWGVDGYVEFADFESADEAPTFAALIGAHLGFGDEAGRLGGFASVGAVPDNDDEVGYGYTVGVEGLASFDNISVFGQLGWAGISTDEEGDETAGLFGPFARVGAVFAASDEFALMADLSYGYTDHFTDEDEEGLYFTAGVKAAFRLPTDFDAFLTAGYEYGHYVDSHNDEVADAHTVKLGLAIPFGGSTKATQVLNPLATAVQPYRGALYGTILD